MTLAHARALVSPAPVNVLRSDPEGDVAALDGLAAWATRFAPAVAPDPGMFTHPTDPAYAMPGLLADVTGCERLYHGEHNLLDQLHRALAQLGFRARLAIASTFGCAWAVARFARDEQTVIDPGHERDAVADLPIRGLRIESDIEEAFLEIGVTTIGELLDLPRKSLPSRFGRALTLRIDQALGSAMETIEPVRPRPPLSAAREFDGPVKQLEAIELTVRELLDELCRLMHTRESGARQLDLVLFRSDCEPWRTSLSVSRFSRDAKHLWSLLRPKVEDAHMGFGVLEVVLTASRTGPLPHRQQAHALLGGDPEDRLGERELAQTVDILTNRLGEDAVCFVQPVPTHLPERVARFVPVVRQPKKRDHMVVAHDRPSVLLPEPRPIDVMAVTPDGPLIRMRWQGRWLDVTATVGPERLTPEWWRRDTLTREVRDYFKVQDEHGRWWWLYREVDARRWFMHGGWI